MTDLTANASALDPVGNRVLAGLLVLCCGGPLVFAAMLTPSDAGMGTHTQLGLPSCGFVAVTGMPCATCGCTTAFAHAADGSLLTAFITQPFGALLALGLAVMTLIAGWSFATGMPLAPIGRVAGHKWMVLFWIGLLLLAWAYKAAMIGMGG